MRNVPNYVSDYYGSTAIWFIAEVVDTTGDRSRVRVRVFGVHGTNIAAGDCPWAVVTYPVTGGQLGSGSLGHNLEVGSWVVGIFADGHDYQQPVILSVVPGGVGSGVPRSQDTENFLKDQGSAGISSFDVDSITITGDSGPEKAYNSLFSGLVDTGISATKLHMLASAFVGVLQLESGTGIDPAATNPSSGAFGIAQWLSSDRIVRRGGDRFLPQDAGGGPFPTTLAGQISYLWFELRGRERGAYRKWISATNLLEAVVGASMFERAEEWHPNISGRYFLDISHPNFKRRLAFAQTAYEKLTYQPPRRDGRTPLAISIGAPS